MKPCVRSDLIKFVA